MPQFAAIVATLNPRCTIAEAATIFRDAWEVLILKKNKEKKRNMNMKLKGKLLVW